MCAVEQEQPGLNHAPSAPRRAAATVRPGAWPDARAHGTSNGELSCASFPYRAHNSWPCRSPARPGSKGHKARHEVPPSAQRQAEDRNIDSERLATVEGFPSRAGKRKLRPFVQVPGRIANNRQETLRRTGCRTLPIGGRELALCGWRRERRLTSLSIASS